MFCNVLVDPRRRDVALSMTSLCTSQAEDRTKCTSTAHSLPRKEEDGAGHKNKSLSNIHSHFTLKNTNHSHKREDRPNKTPCEYPASHPNDTCFTKSTW